MCPENENGDKDLLIISSETHNKAATVTSCLLATSNIEFPAAEPRFWGGKVSSRVIARGDCQEPGGLHRLCGSVGFLTSLFAASSDGDGHFGAPVA